MPKELAVGIRIHRKKATTQSTSNDSNSQSTDIDLNPLIHSVEAALSCSQVTTVIVAYDGQDPDLENALLFEFSQDSKKGVKERKRLQLIRIPIWGNFIPALNGILSACSGMDFILFCSVEVLLSSKIVNALLTQFDQDTLLVGARLPGHEFQSDSNPRPLSGVTCPWNTLCIWSLDKLTLTGFLHVSERPQFAGVEEVCSATLIQRLIGRENAKIILLDLKIGGSTTTANSSLWQVNWTDPERRKWHEEKMKSKSRRAFSQLELLNLKSFEGHVYHLALRENETEIE